MTTNTTLEISLVPTIDKEAMAKQIKAALDMAFNVAGSNVAGTPTSTSTSSTTTSTSGGKTGGSTETKEEKNEKEEKKKKQLQTIQTVVQTGFNLGERAVKGVWGIVQEIYQRVRQSSQFLQTVESLFNMAMTLLLMPLGNALAETILPKTIELVDNIVGMYDKFDEFAGQGDLRGILNYVMKQGLEQVGEYFEGIGGLLEDQGGLLGSLGHVLTTIGDFVSDGKLGKLLKGMLGALAFVADYFPYFVGMWVTYKLAEIELMALQIYTTATSNTVGGWLGLGLTGAALAGGVFAGLKVGGAFAEGGYIPATEGGQIIQVAEGGEGEYVIPESKMGSIGGGNNTFNFYGYDMDQVEHKVKEVLRDEIRTSQYRSGY